MTAVFIRCLIKQMAHIMTFLQTVVKKLMRYNPHLLFKKILQLSLYILTVYLTDALLNESCIKYMPDLYVCDVHVILQHTVCMHFLKNHSRKTDILQHFKEITCY